MPQFRSSFAAPTGFVAANPRVRITELAGAGRNGLGCKGEGAASASPAPSPAQVRMAGRSQASLRRAS